MNNAPTPDFQTTPAKELHFTVACAIDAIRAVADGIAPDSPNWGAAMALGFIADGLVNARYEGAAWFGSASKNQVRKAGVEI